MKLLDFIFCVGLGGFLEINAQQNDRRRISLGVAEGTGKSRETAAPARINQSQMNSRIKEKIQLGRFNAQTYKQCIADELLKSG